MKRKIVFVLVPFLLAVIVFVAAMMLLGKTSGKGALQVTANPKSNVYINGKFIGQTPLCKCDPQDTMSIGDYTVKVAPVETGYLSFEEKITIAASVLTVVDRTFTKGGDSEGSIITLSPLQDKKALELLVLSFPKNAMVYLNSSQVGQAPLSLKKITESDHELRLAKEGYRDKVVRIKTVAGYKLITTVYLAVNPVQLLPSVIPSSSPSATPSLAKVIILQTPTGFLRVRSEPSIEASEAGRVNPGDILEMVSEQKAWLEIRLPNGKIGWISSTYAKKQ